MVMFVNSVNNQIGVIKNNNTSNCVATGSAFKVREVHKDVSKTVRVGVFLSTLIGVVAATAYTLKKDHGYKFVEFFKGITHVKFNKEKEEVEKLVKRVAIGSVAGGLIGGAIFDKKENFKAKCRESIIQLVGNIFTPLLCVSKGMRGFDNHVIPYLKKTHNIGGTTEKALSFSASAICLITSIFLGNKIGNYINKEVFNVNDDRKLKLSDMSPHIDDTCLAMSLVAPKNVVGDWVSRGIPIALMVAGYSTGVAQEHSENQETQCKATNITPDSKENASV